MRVVALGGASYGLAVAAQLEAVHAGDAEPALPDLEQPAASEPPLRPLHALKEPR